jgi:hypothetical protein
MKDSMVCIKYRRLHHLRPLVEKWIQIHKSYIPFYKKTFGDNDALYWWNERANISILAGAVWESGEYALEEFRVDKKYRKERRRGRADLWFSWRGIGYLAEVKRIGVPLSNKACECTEKIRKSLESARKDVVITKMGSYAERALGIVFVVPYLPKNEKTRMNETLGRLLDEIEKVDYDIMAYIFPRSSRSLCDKKYYFPGVVLLGRAPKRG